jgi:hypothetical protein
MRTRTLTSKGTLRRVRLFAVMLSATVQIAYVIRAARAAEPDGAEAVIF